MNNMFNDDITKSIASAVKDVLEGKPAVIKEEMDPTDHVKKSDEGKFCVYNPAGKKVAEFDTKPEADKYAIDNHKKIMAKEVAQPEPKGEKEFKAKHVVKKSGEKEDGTVVKEMTISIGEKLNKKGNTTVDVDYIGDNDYSKKLEKAFKVKIKSTGNTTADITGPRKNIIDLLKSNAYLMDDDEIEETFPKELGEEVEPEEDEAKLKESEKQKAYQKFFNSALKKFGVSSPAELKDDAKKKEFFAYIDKNYKAKAEEIEAKGKDDEDVNEAMSQKDMEKRLKLIKKAVEKINRQNLRNAKADAMKMMKDSGMFDEDASDEEEVDELTDKQKKLPAGLQKAIKAKEQEEVKEGTLKVSMYAGPDAGGDDPKKMGLKVKKTGETEMGDDVEISGPDAKLVKFAQRNLGVSGRNLRAVQKELDDM